MRLDFCIAKVGFKSHCGKVLLCSEDLWIMYVLYVLLVRMTQLATCYEYECFVAYSVGYEWG